MDMVSLLATALEEMPVASPPLFEVDQARDFLFGQVSAMHWLYALMLLSVGVVYMAYGWRIFRVLVVIGFGFMGMFLGIFAADKISTSDNAIVWGGLFGMGLFAAIAVPLMKWCVSILGAVAGGILASGIWIAFGFSEHYLPAGFIAGFIAGGLFSFIMLKVSVMLFTSLCGSLVILVSLLALLYQYDVRVSNPVTYYAQGLVFSYQWFLPVALITLTLAGMLLQHKFIKRSSEWEI